jgi:hypothetical protein
MKNRIREFLEDGFEGDGFEGGLMRPPEQSLMTALGLAEDHRLSDGAKMFLGIIVVEHIKQVMGNDWLAWEVLRVLKRRYPRMGTDEDFRRPNPHPNKQWSPTTDAIWQVITHPDL